MSEPRSIRWRAYLAFLVLLLAASAHAASGTLQGRVLDPQGRAVSGAHVTVEKEGAALHREATTDPAGGFTLPELPPGSYTLVAQAQGFASRTHKGLALAVGQSYKLDVRLEVGGVSETVEAVAEGLQLVKTGSSTVDTVIGSTAIERLPLNGRNFLELAFLVPGNVPTPNFDPTKTNTVVVASAGQFGRGGMITIDGADNNDDVVGGPLQNIPQDAVQEFQIATNRYTAESGRSAAAAINVVTRSGTDTLQGTASFFLRDKSLQALPATYDRTQEAPPFDREQYALALGGPIKKGTAYWFAALEYRDQNGAVLVGARDVASRTIKRTFAAAPLKDWLGTARFDWSPSGNDRVTLRYSFENADDTGASTLDRSIGSAVQRQASSNGYNSVLASWVKTLSSSTLNTLSASYSRFRNDIVPVAPGEPQLTFPSIQDGSSFRVPQATHQDRLQLTDSLALVRGNHSLKFGGEAQFVKSALDLGVFQAGRLEMVQDFPQYDANGDGRVDDNDLLFAVTLRSGFPDRDLVLDQLDNKYFAFFAQDDFRVTPELTLNLGLRFEMDTDVKNVSGYGETNPLVKDFYEGDRSADKNNFGPRLGFTWRTREEPSTSRAGGECTTTASPSRSPRSSAASTVARCPWR